MRLPIMALALSTLCLTGCGKEQAEIRVAPIAPDPARLASCPVTFAIPPELVPLAPFTLPDGRSVVLLSTVIERERATASYILTGRGSWQLCRSVVTYAEDWGARMGAGSAVRP